MSNTVLLIDSVKTLRLLKSLVGFRISRRRMGLIRTLIVFGAGFYSGVYASQNYNIPPLDEPAVLIDKFAKLANEYLEQYRKDK